MKIVILKRKKRYTIKEIYILFFSVYVFLSGFVFVEPSPAELWFLLFIPFFLLTTRFRLTYLAISLLLFFPLFISFSFGYSLFGFINPRFFVIDLYLFALFLFLISYDLSTKEYEILIDKTVSAWVIAGLINVLFGFFIFSTGKTTVLGKRFVVAGLEYVGFFKDPNVLGPFLIVPSLYLIEDLYKKTRKIFKNVILLAFFGVGILLTFSRAAWLNYLVGVFITVAMYEAKNKKIYHLKTLIILLFLLAGILSIFSLNLQVLNFDFKDFLYAKLGLQSYDKDRFEAQAASIEMVKMNVFSGIGPGNYEKITNNYSAHSTYLRYLGERGLLGLTTFLIFLLYIFKKTISSKQHVFLLASLVGTIVNSLFIDSLHWRHLWILFVLIVLNKKEDGTYRP